MHESPTPRLLQFSAWFSAGGADRSLRNTFCSETAEDGSDVSSEHPEHFIRTDKTGCSNTYVPE